MLAQPQAPAAIAEAARGYETRIERIERAGAEPLAVRFILKPDTAGRGSRLIDATTSALKRLDEWHGPLAIPELTVIDLPWNSPWAGASYAGTVVTTARALEPPSDRALERTLVAALARQYWPVPAGSSDAQRRLGEGLALYVGVRAIHEQLEGRHFATARWFGGFVPYTTRSIEWSPSPTDPRPRMRHFAEVERPAEAPWRAASSATGGEAQRVALALHTLERYLGWPAMQQVLQGFNQRWRAGQAAENDLAAVITEQRGRDLRWFFDDAFRSGTHLDYGISGFSSEPDQSAAGSYRTHVSLQRFGDGVFTGTAEPASGSFRNARSLRVVTRFEDGTVAEDWWDGRVAEFALTYSGPARAVSVSVDPDAMLLLDRDRSNNTRAPAHLTETGARLAASWFVWLQDVMLAATALL